MQSTLTLQTAIRACERAQQGPPELVWGERYEKTGINTANPYHCLLQESHLTGARGSLLVQLGQQILLGVGSDHLTEKDHKRPRDLIKNVAIDT
jgi:hypothetical protein